MASDFDQQDLTLFATGVTLGAVIGAGVALLLAPQSGRRTRGKIRRTAEDLSEHAEETVRHVAEDAKRTAREVGKKARPTS